MKIRVATTEDAKSIQRIYAPYVEKTAITFEYEVKCYNKVVTGVANEV